MQTRERESVRREAASGIDDTDGLERKKRNVSALRPGVRYGCISCMHCAQNDSLVSSSFANYVSNLPIYRREGSGTVIPTIKKLMSHGISLENFKYS